MLSRHNLHEYQRKGVEFIKSEKRCFLCLDMGLGKTATTLTAITDLIDSFSVSKVLVVSPLRVAKSVWPKEPSQWSHLEDLRVSLVTGNERQRMAALQQDADIYSINRENLVWLVELLGKKWPFDCVVIDESSSFKNPSSKRFRALKRVLPNTEYMVLLTGTPSPNSLLDLWAQCYLVDFGMALGRTFTGYKQRFFEQDYMGYNWTLRQGGDKTIHNLIRPFTLSMSAEDYLELPKRIDLIEYVDLPNRTMANYLEFEKELLLELDDGEEIEAVNAAALAGKLLQWCNGAVYTDEARNWSEVHKLKLDVLEELFEYNDEPMLVAYNFKSDLARIKDRFPDAVVLDKDPETIERWNRGEILMLLAHPASAGHGLNLQKGGSLIVWFGLSWSLELYQQFNARLYRQGQTKPVRIVHIIARGCIDERVMQVLDGKDQTQRRLLDALKPTGQTT